MIWHPPTPLARQAAAADLWLELTGRKHASAVLLVKEAMDEVAAAQSAPVPSELGRTTKRGLIGGGLIGGGLAGLAAHRSTPAVHAGHAALGGSIVGGTIGAAGGLAHGIRKIMAQPKQASAYTALRAAVSKNPSTRAAAGAAAVGLPLAGIGYGLELRRHTPGPDGDSPHRAATKFDKERYAAQVAASPATGSRLKELYLGLRDQAAEDASRSPRAYAALGSAAYAVPGAITGAALGSRILR